MQIKQRPKKNIDWQSGRAAEAVDESPTTERPCGGRKGSLSLFAFACHRCGEALLYCTPIDTDADATCKKKDWEPSKWSRLCSTHFKEEDIDRTLTRVQLKENVEPSILPQIPPPPQVRRCPPSSKRKYKEEISIPSTSSQDSPRKQGLRKKLNPRAGTKRIFVAKGPSDLATTSYRMSRCLC
ncbi:hypothetical protein J6590_106761 [Homalodisca vitripennis]|nr:hypothetical protein J6590_106761 [Homalodisca vitripennis]